MNTPTTAGKFLSFPLNHIPYAIPIESVKEIHRVQPITPVPQTPEYVLGVINLRGKILPVIDLRLRLGTQGRAQLLSGIGKLPEGVILVLDVPKLIAPETGLDPSLQNAAMKLLG